MWDKFKQWFDTKIKNKKEKVKSNIIFLIILFANPNAIYSTFILKLVIFILLILINRLSFM